MIVYLDTETTGLSAANGDAIVEIAIVDHRGRPLVDTLIDPQRPIPWAATRVHGIRDDMVRGKPTLKQILPLVRNAIRDNELVIYNASFDVSFFPDRLADAGSVRCAMRAFNTARGGRAHKLAAAAAHVGHKWSGSAHRALADALACRSVWEWLLRQQTPSSPVKPRIRPVALHPPPSAQVVADAREVICVRCSEPYRLPERIEDDSTCPNCRRLFKPTNVEVIRGATTRSNEVATVKTADPPTARTQIPMASYRQISWKPPKIAFLCCYCGTEGIDDDSHLVNCKTCRRWVFTR